MFVIALGGNALLQRGQSLEAAIQLHNIEVAAAAIATMAQAHTVIVTHGNCPQVGLLALQAEAYRLLPHLQSYNFEDQSFALREVQPCPRRFQEWTPTLSNLRFGHRFTSV